MFEILRPSVKITSKRSRANNTTLPIDRQHETKLMSYWLDTG